ncbi:MAG: alpha/beta fold hydrolase [Alphaproteobacteria bacterium]|nr:alpha/beta fold hydrolase [Alphaproteobacteria bacterium]
MPHTDTGIFYAAEGSGPPVLLIQGAGVIGEGWRPQIDALRERYRLAILDNRGFGRSAALKGRLTIERMADDVLGVMDALGWERAHVAGHSMGGLIAQQLALQAPERVRSLALMCTFVRGADASRPVLWKAWIGLRCRVGTLRMRRHAFLEMVMPPAWLDTQDRDALAAELAPLFGYDLARQPGFVLKQVGAMRAHDASGRLSALSGVPTLVLTGALDRVAPAEQGRALAAAIPGARYVELPDTAHGAPIQRALQVNAVFAEHLDRVESEA